MSYDPQTEAVVSAAAEAGIFDDRPDLVQASRTVAALLDQLGLSVDMQEAISLLVRHEGLAEARALAHRVRVRLGRVA